MSDEDGFPEQESTAEAVVFMGLLAAIGLVAIVAGTAKWWRGWLFVLVCLLLPAVASAQSERATHLALGSYLVSSYYDVAITSWALGRGGAHEANPLLAPIIDQSGVPVGMTVKGAMHVGIAALILHYHKDAPKRVFWVTVGLTAAQVTVDALNVRTVRR